MRRTLLAISGMVAAVAAAPGRATANDDVVVEPDGFALEVPAPIGDGYVALVDHEARAALAAGELRRAWKLYRQLVELRPGDTAAWREYGRLTAALGSPAEAVRIFRDVDERQGSAPDPELHFLWGQALVALGRENAAEQQLAIAERELALAEPSRQRTLFLARIHALRGEADDAAALYRELLATTDDADERLGLSLQLGESYIIAEDWAAAEPVLEGIVAQHPKHERARAMLAWVLESRGKLTAELEVRAALAGELTENPGRLASDHARALERAGDFEGALAEYRRADEMGVDVDAAVERVESRLNPEIAVTGLFASDPLGDRVATLAGASVPIGAHIRLVATAEYELASAEELPAVPAAETRLAVGSAWGIATLGRGAELGAGVLGWHHEERGGKAGAQALARTAPNRRWRMQMRARYNAPWRESAATVRDAGTEDGAELQAYASPNIPRLTFMAGGRVRRLGLDLGGFTGGAHAVQLFGAAGLDVQLLQGNGRSSRSRMFGGEMLTEQTIESGLVLSYRHYEGRSDDPFTTRLRLVERSSLDELSTTARYVVDGDGVLALQAQAGVGYDNQRDLWQWRGGGRLDVSPTARIRLSVSLLTSSEVATGIIGRRYAGTLGLHVDL